MKEADLAVLWKRWPAIRPSPLLCVRARGQQGTCMGRDGEANVSRFVKFYKLTWTNLSPGKQNLATCDWCLL